jgi:hypothetical protein
MSYLLKDWPVPSFVWIGGSEQLTRSLEEEIGFGCDRGGEFGL